VSNSFNIPPRCSFDNKTSAQTVGVIFKTERDSFRVLDQHGQVRLVHPHQISMRRDSTRAIATDSEGHELRVNDNVKEIDGEVSISYEWSLLVLIREPLEPERSCFAHTPIFLCLLAQ